MNKLMKQVAAGAAALALVFAIAGTASAVTVYAVVTGHAAHSDENNKPETWGEDCVKVNAGEGGLGIDDKTFVLEHDYSLVVVKAGGNNLGDNANTLFGDSPSAGETVWADSNGNGEFDEGDKNISHIIFCDESDTETSSTTTDTFTSSQQSTTDSQSSSTTSTETTETTTSFSDSNSDTTTTTQPPSDTLGDTGSGQQSGSMWLLLAALGVLAGSVIVLAPSKAKSRD
jgi:hypothetical protein